MTPSIDCVTVNVPFFDYVNYRDDIKKEQFNVQCFV